MEEYSGGIRGPAGVGVEAKLKRSAGTGLGVGGPVPAGVVGVGFGLNVAKASDILSVHGKEWERFNLRSCFFFMLFFEAFTHCFSLVKESIRWRIWVHANPFEALVYRSTNPTTTTTCWYWTVLVPKEESLESTIMKASFKSLSLRFGLKRKWVFFFMSFSLYVLLVYKNTKRILPLYGCFKRWKVKVCMLSLLFIVREEEIIWVGVLLYLEHKPYTIPHMGIKLGVSFLPYIPI